MYFIDIEAVAVSDVIQFSLRTNAFDLTCISTGGPATTVTWTRDSVTVTEGTETHYDTSTHEYTHTLTVIGIMEGLYTCTVANDRPSSASANINVQGEVFVRPADIASPTNTHGFCICLNIVIILSAAPSPPSNVTVLQHGLKSADVSWTSGEPAVTGYNISYQTLDGGHSGSVTNETATSTIITGLMTGATYSITIVATSSTFNSTVTTAPDITIGTGLIVCV